MKQGVYLKNQEQFERSLREVILEHLHSIVDSLVSDADSYLTLQFNCSMEEFYLVQYQDLRQMQAFQCNIFQTFLSTCSFVFSCQQD